MQSQGPGMSAETIRKQVTALLAGRWQIPLALTAAIVAGLTLYRLIPPAAPLDFNALMTGLTALEQAEGPAAAAKVLADQLLKEPRLVPAQRAALHERMADLLFRFERAQTAHNPGNARNLLEHDRRARDLGLAPSSRATFRDALAARWLGDGEAALAGFRSALGTELGLEDRRVALRALVELLEDRPEAREECRQAEVELLNDESVSPAYFWWSLHRAVRAALDENDAGRARELLTQYGDRLKTSDLKGYLDYLWACVMLHEGRPEEAAPLVRWVDEWLTSKTRSTRELDDFGHLPSLNRWLAGKVHLASHRPEEALAQFDEALAYQPGPELRVVVNLGRGAALGTLERPAAALEAFQAAVADGRALPPGRRDTTLAELRSDLKDLAERQEAAGEYDGALRYLTLATEITSDEAPDQLLDLCAHLSRMYRAAAQVAPAAESRRSYHEQAGRNLERAAALARFDESHRAALLWSAVDEYDQAGRIADAQRMLRQFVAGRSSHPAMPQALLRLGQTCEAVGNAEEALDWYTRVRSEYPRLEEAARAREATAGVLVSQGPERYADAERLLAELLTDGSIAPDAAVYRDALLDLCELLYHQGRYGEAIGRLQDFIGLYPDDAEQVRGQFTLADAYRCSAYALRAASPEETATPAATESRQRFRQAADLYDKLLATLDAAARADAESQLYARLALFNEADCWFELNEPEALRVALATYRTAAARYEAHPAALTAQVQIANVCLRLGEVPEAARAVERARWLLRAIPAENFAWGHESDRGAWEQFLALVAASDLFQVGLTSTSWPPRTAQEEP
jgi:tetratricopeptide (TPR) repeat protein